MSHAFPTRVTAATGASWLAIDVPRSTTPHHRGRTHPGGCHTAVQPAQGRAPTRECPRPTAPHGPSLRTLHAQTLQTPSHGIGPGTVRTCSQLCHPGVAHQQRARRRFNFPRSPNCESIPPHRHRGTRVTHNCQSLWRASSAMRSAPDFRNRRVDVREEEQCAHELVKKSSRARGLRRCSPRPHALGGAAPTAWLFHTLDCASRARHRSFRCQAGPKLPTAAVSGSVGGFQCCGGMLLRLVAVPMLHSQRVR